MKKSKSYLVEEKRLKDLRKRISELPPYEPISVTDNVLSKKECKYFRKTLNKYIKKGYAKPGRTHIAKTDKELFKNNKNLRDMQETWKESSDF